jgi:hypothetical protein
MEIQRADPRERRRALVLLAVGTVAGAIALLWLKGWLDEQITRPPAEARATLLAAFRIAATVMVLSISAASIYLWRLGWRIERSARFPPPGQRVLRDTPVLKGPDAISRGRRLRGLALALLAATAILLFCALTLVRQA